MPLRFLGAGKYRATIWEDGATPNDVTRVEREVVAGDVLTLKLASAGGAVVVLEPLAARAAKAKTSAGSRRN